MMPRALWSIYSVWEREIYDYLKNLYFNGARLIVEPLLFVLVFGIGLGSRVEIEGIGYLHFMAPGVILLVSMNNSYMTTAFRLIIARDFDKVLKSTISGPIRPLEIIMGYVLSGVSQAVLATMIFIVILRLVFGLVFTNLLVIYLFIISISVFFAAVAVIFSMAVDDSHNLMILTSLVVIPMGFFCGIFFPVEEFPALIKPVVLMIPLTRAVLNVREVFLTGSPADTFLIDLLYVAAFAFVFLILGNWVFRKKVIL